MLAEHKAKKRAFDRSFAFIHLLNIFLSAPFLIPSNSEGEKNQRRWLSFAAIKFTRQRMSSQLSHCRGIFSRTKNNTLMMLLMVVLRRIAKRKAFLLMNELSSSGQQTFGLFSLRLDHLDPQAENIRSPR